MGSHDSLLLLSHLPLISMVADVLKFKVSNTFSIMTILLTHTEKDNNLVEPYWLTELLYTQI